MLCFRCGVDDSGLVRLQDAQPVIDIAGVAVVKFGREIEVGAYETLSDRGDDFFERIGIIAKTLPERPREPVRVCAPMETFVRKGTGKMILGFERDRLRHLDEVMAGAVVRLVTAMADVGGDRGEKRIMEEMISG